MPPGSDDEKVRHMERMRLAEMMRQDLAATIDARIDRYLSVEHHSIIPLTSFAGASSECIDLFRDGHFYGAVSLSLSGRRRSAHTAHVRVQLVQGLGKLREERPVASPKAIH